MKKTLVLATLVAGLLLTTGCAPTVYAPVAPGAAPIPTPDSLSSAQYNKILEEHDEQMRSTLTNRYPDVVVPTVERIDLVAIDDFAPIMSTCLADAGYPVTIAPDGGIEFSGTADEAEPYAIASYVCSMQHVIDPKYLAPLNQSQLTYLYDYTVNTLTPCLQKAGYTVSAPPTLNDYIHSYPENGGWTPYQDVDPGPLWASLNKQCPQQPPNLYGITE